MVWKRIPLYSDKNAASIFRIKVFKALALAALRGNLSIDDDDYINEDDDGNDQADIFQGGGTVIARDAIGRSRENMNVTYLSI
jgi:hypothetical protein